MGDVILDCLGGIPQVHENALLGDALIEMSNKSLGMTAAVNDAGELTGIFTDGDLRRVLAQTVDIRSAKLQDHMTPNCKTGRPDMLAAEALTLMEQHKINALLIVNQQQQLVGALNMHDLLRAGVV